MSEGIDQRILGFDEGFRGLSVEYAESLSSRIPQR